MNDLGNEIFKYFETLAFGSKKEQKEFSKGLTILQNKYADFFKNEKNDKKIITHYFALSRPSENSSVKAIVFKDYDKLPSSLELEVVDLFKSVFTE